MNQLLYTATMFAPYIGGRTFGSPDIADGLLNWWNQTTNAPNMFEASRKFAPLLETFAMPAAGPELTALRAGATYTAVRGVQLAREAGPLAGDLIEAGLAREGLLLRVAPERVGGVPNTTNALIDQLAFSKDVQRATLRNALDASGAGQVAHHLIPLEAQSAYPDLVQKAAQGGFNFNGANNGILLDVVDHGGGGAHPIYNSVVLQELGRVSPNLSAEETAFALQRRADILRDAINNGTFKPWQ